MMEDNHISTVQQFIERQRELFNQFRYKLTPADISRMFEDGLLSRERMEQYLFPGADSSVCFASLRWLYAVANIDGMIGPMSHLTCSEPEQWRVPSFWIDDLGEDNGVVLDSSFERQIVQVVYEECPVENGTWFFVVGCRGDGDQMQEPEFYAFVNVIRSPRGYHPGDITIYTSRTLANIEDYAMTNEQRARYFYSDYYDDMDDLLDYDSDDFNLMRHIVAHGYSSFM